MASRLEGLLALRTLIDDAEHYPERLDSRASFAFGHAFLHDFFEGGHDARLELRGVVHQRAETAARLAREVLHRLRLQAPGLRELLRRVFTVVSGLAAALAGRAELRTSPRPVALTRSFFA